MAKQSSRFQPIVKTFPLPIIIIKKKSQKFNKKMKIRTILNNTKDTYINIFPLPNEETRTKNIRNSPKKTQSLLKASKTIGNHIKNKKKHMITRPMEQAFNLYLVSS
jgi:hypothetical protein